MENDNTIIVIIMILYFTIDSHRRRSDTAQRLERLKRDKHRLSQIQHITWDSSVDGLMLIVL